MLDIKLRVTLNKIIEEEKREQSTSCKMLNWISKIYISVKCKKEIFKQSESLYI